MARRPDGWDKTSGSARYVADAVPPGHLVGAVLTTRSPHASVRVDVAALRAVPGVVAALGPDDDPGVTFSSNPHGGGQDRRVLGAVGHYVGDVVGAVAAIDRVSLRRALALEGAVEEVPLPFVADALVPPRGVVANEGYPDNVLARVALGERAETVARALGRAPRRHRSEVRLLPAPHGFLERVGAGAAWVDGRCRVWSCTQCPSLVRQELARILGLAPAAVVMEPVYVGGGFGGKEELALEPVAALLSRAAGGRPVLVELTREQCTRAYRTRHGGRISVETGLDEDGTFVARWVEVVLDGGPYDGHSGGVAANALGAALRLYPRGSVGGTAVALASNRVPGGAYRGYGATQASFACETHLDELAAHLGHDPVALRRRNLARSGDRDPVTGQTMPDVRALDCLDAVAMPAGCEPEPARDARCRRGRGVAVLVCTSAAVDGGAPDVAEVRCRFDAGVDGPPFVVETGVVEAGQGLHTALAVTVSRELEVQADDVAVVAPPPERPLVDPGMFGSRGAHVTCAAGAAAAEALRACLVGAAAARLAVAPNDVVLDIAGRVAVAPGRRLELASLGPLEATGRHEAHDVALAFGAQAVELVVDTATGAVEIERVRSAHDVGRVLDADSVRAQVEGGVLQGLGAALSEELTIGPDGAAAEIGLLGHLLPTLARLPEVEVHTLASRPGDVAKGLGEAPVMGIPAAVASAVAAATGARLRTYPLKPERVVRALRTGVK